MPRREVCVPLYHAERLPAAELLDREEVHAFHGQQRGEGVPRVVESEVLDLRRGESEGNTRALRAPDRPSVEPRAVTITSQTRTPAAEEAGATVSRLPSRPPRSADPPAAPLP